MQKITKVKYYIKHIINSIVNKSQRKSEKKTLMEGLNSKGRTHEGYIGYGT